MANSPFIRVKNTANLLRWADIGIGVPKEYRLATTSAPSYVKVFLWKDRDSLRENVYGTSEEVVATVISTNYYVYREEEEGEIVDYRIRPKFAEMHFIENTWDMSTVAHEAFHVVFEYLAVLSAVRNIPDIFEEGGPEEAMAHMQGELTRCVYRWLWGADTVSARNSSWRRIKHRSGA